MNAAKRVVGATLGSAVAAAALVYLLPLPVSWQESAVFFYGPLAMIAGVVCLHIGAVVLFLMALSTYTEQLRRAYVVICASLILTTFGTLQLPIIGLFNWWSTPWVTYGFVGLPFVLSGVAAYGGVRLLARLVGVGGWPVRWSVVLPGVLGLCALSFLLPHVSAPVPEAAFDAAIGVLVWTGSFLLGAAGLLWGVCRRIGAHYTKAMLLMMLGFLGAFLTVLISLGGQLATVEAQDKWSFLIYSGALIAGLWFVAAGYAFTKTREI